ncbi:reverse transcriptase family protein [Aureimonas leprariae]|uniref:RNA-directed DNA polymerase n=1 Tax=Plantimonas leprariae TaxID=2615207 RepID=A0A7V7TXS3_9HYPH|nr:reverse transcriptase family protein [Aureimonas leprariae]KAB0681306.1 RNA-directed DNA polymerase [Aureimonas leprariae]
MSTFAFDKDLQQLDLFDSFKNENREVIVAEYSRIILENGAAVIFDTEHLSRLLGFSQELLFSISAASNKYYREYTVLKRSGGRRVINEPLPTLKMIQRFILAELLDGVRLHKAARGYRKNHTLRGGAIIHRGRPYMLTLDVQDFFPSINQYQVFQALLKLGYTKQISRLITGLCTLHDGLPQGAPTSPLLSNLVLYQADKAIFDHCVVRGLFYTRYADDMTFSSKEDNVVEIIPVVRTQLSNVGLRINPRKTNVSRRGSRKYVNGIVVNVKPNILKTERRSLRQEMFYIKKYGIEGHIRWSKVEAPYYVDKLIGRLTFALFVTKDKRYSQEIRYLSALKKAMQ